jgi:hypothetical protein
LTETYTSGEWEHSLFVALVNPIVHILTPMESGMGMNIQVPSIATTVQGLDTLMNNVLIM